MVTLSEDCNITLQRA